MATLVNRKMWWALVDKVIPCLVVEQNLENATVTVLLQNGARHEADAYDVRATEGEARKRQQQLAENHECNLYMANTYPGIGEQVVKLRSLLKGEA